MMMTRVLDGMEHITYCSYSLLCWQTENIEELIATILEKWKSYGPKEDDGANKAKIDVDEQLAKLLEASKVQTVVKERQYTEEEKKIREQILAQYSQVRPCLITHIVYC